MLSGLGIAHGPIHRIILRAYCLVSISRSHLWIVESWMRWLFSLNVIIISILFLFFNYSLLTINVSWVFFNGSLNLKLASILYLLNLHLFRINNSFVERSLWLSLLLLCWILRFSYDLMIRVNRIAILRGSKIIVIGICF